MEKDKDYKIEKLSDSRISIEAVVNPEEMKKYYDQAIIKLSNDLEVGGFRKGKVPKDIAINHLEKQRILIESVDMAVSDKYYNIISAEKDLITLESPKIDFKSKIDNDLMKNGFTFIAEVDVYPDINLPDYKKIKIERESNEISESEINSTLDDLAKKRSKLMDIKDDNYTVQKGDWVDIDFAVKVDESELSDAGSKHFPLVVGGNSLIPGFEDQLIGLEKGGNKNFSLELDNDFRDKRMAGKKVSFDVKVNEIKNIEQPKLDDGFALSLGIKGVENIESLKKHVKESLENEKKLKLEESTRNDILEKINNDFNVILPKSMIVSEKKVMWQEFEDNLKSRGIDPSEYLKKEKLDKDKVMSGWEDIAIKRVRIGMIIRKLIELENIKVESSEIEDIKEKELMAIRKQLESSDNDNWKKTFSIYQEQYNKSEILETLKQKLTFEKLFSRLDELMVIKK